MAAISTKQKSHIQQVDYIRAIAALVVTLYHLGGKTLPVLNYGWLGVYMFFLLSGFIICWAIPENYSWKLGGRFILKRIIRIEPPYIISIVLAIIMNFFWVAHYHPDWVNAVCHLAYLNSFLGQPYLSPVYWTLGIEFQFYLFVALCFPWFTSKWGQWLLLLLSILPTFLHVPGTTLINSFQVFALGILYYLYKVKGKALNGVLVFGVLITACSVYSVGMLQTCAALFALGLLLLPLKSYPVISFLSKISFSLYLTHDIIGSNLVVYLGMLLPKSLFFKGIEFLTGIGVSILFAWLFYLLVEKPCLKLSKQVNYNLSLKVIS
jgi:peptidoglycan/LPS O-acetylase OafA/YrhL